MPTGDWAAAERHGVCIRGTRSGSVRRAPSGDSLLATSGCDGARLGRRTRSGAGSANGDISGHIGVRPCRSLDAPSSEVWIFQEIDPDVARIARVESARFQPAVTGAAWFPGLCCRPRSDEFSTIVEAMLEQARRCGTAPSDDAAAPEGILGGRKGSERVVGHAEMVPGRIVGRSDRQGRFEMRQGLRRPTLLHEPLAALEAQARVAGLQRQGLLEAGDRLVPSFQAPEGVGGQGHQEPVVGPIEHFASPQGAREVFAAQAGLGQIVDEASLRIAGLGCLGRCQRLVPLALLQGLPGLPIVFAGRMVSLRFEVGLLPAPDAPIHEGIGG